MTADRRAQLLDPATLARARALKGTGRWREAELRYVELKKGLHLQVTTYDRTQAFTSNHPVGSAEAEAAVDALLAEPFGRWRIQLGDAASAERSHDQAKERLLAEDDPVFRALGLSDAQGRLKPSRQAKFRQVEEFLRQLDAAVTDAIGAGRLRTPTADEPLRLVDLGCGNGYLTFAAQRYLASGRDLPVVVTGVDVKEQSREHNAAVAAELGVPARFVVGSIDGVELAERPDVVLALHACDTATDEALARAIGWQAPLVLAAPCCHHDIAAQLRRAPAPEPYAMLVRDGILRERLADTLTDALRASLLRISGYRVDVVQFVESRHTPRNTMLRATRTGAPASDDVRAEYDELVATWGLRPRLGELLGITG